MAIAAFALSSLPRAEVANDGSATPAAHSIITVCHDGCVILRINDRVPLVRDTDLMPAAASAIGLDLAGGDRH
jgi:hypothetical protein